MKKNSLIAIAILFSISVFGHNSKEFQGSDSTIMIKIADTIVSLAKHKFIFHEIKCTDSLSSKYTVTYNQDTNSANMLTIKFAYSKIMVGKNEDLEIKGTPIYEMSTIQGSFLDIFPYWKKNINQDADAVKITSSMTIGDEKTFIMENNYRRQFRLRKLDDIWQIFYKDYKIETKPKVDNTALLKNLKSLLDAGALTHKEYDIQKQKLLNQL